MRTLGLHKFPRSAVFGVNVTGLGIGIKNTTILILVWLAFCSFYITDPSFGSDFMMKGPVTKVKERSPKDDLETSTVRIAMLGLIRIYQQFVSPIGGVNRCGFRPSCSHYGYQAIQEQGPIMGTIMIGDRLTRCNIFKKPGPDYPLLPSGKLYDPVSNNLPFGK
jgi:putative membrane protein insertion efficiency factor